MKKTSKLLLLALSAVLIFTLSGCNKSDKNEPTTIAQSVVSDFQKKMKSSENSSTEVIANELLKNQILSFASGAVPVEPGYLNGFSEEINGFTEGAMFGPIIGSIPFVGYVFRVDENQDAFIQMLKEKADLRWNICTQADEMVTSTYKNTILFVMAPISFDIE